MAEHVENPDADDVGRAIALFLDRVNTDGRLAPSFEGLDGDRLHKHARAVVIAALGGPDLYSGRDLGAAHSALALSDQDFDATVDHLVASLADVGIGDGLIAALAARLEPLRGQIVAE